MIVKGPINEGTMQYKGNRIQTYGKAPLVVSISLTLTIHTTSISRMKISLPRSR
jgi:hypothetical protein